MSKYDLSKLIFVEKYNHGYGIRLTRRDGQDIALNYISIKENYDSISLARYNAITHAQHIMDDLLDIIEKVSGKELPMINVKLISGENVFDSREVLDNSSNFDQELI